MTFYKNDVAGGIGHGCQKNSLMSDTQKTMNKGVMIPKIWVGESQKGLKEK